MQASKDIEKIAYNILIDSKSAGKFPTPVDDIVKYAELKISNNSLSDIHPAFVTKQIHILKRAISKVLGAIDLRQKKIYLDLNQKTPKKNFVKLHEVGHRILPWQAKSFEYIDDEKTLDLEEKDRFEHEASYFASSVLFQLDRFDDEAEKYPLSIKSILHLSKLFGSSFHAAARRYTEFSNKRCGIIILNRGNPITIRNYFQSKDFTCEFGNLEGFWKDNLNISLPFIKDIGIKKFRDDGLITITYNGVNIILNYHFFDTTFNYFVFIKPLGEQLKSRVKFITK
jgi:Zn-dependent peptidase ImmA (M78 family)